MADSELLLNSRFPPVRQFGMFHTESITITFTPSHTHSVSVSRTSMMAIARHKVPDVSNKTSMLQLADTAYEGDVSARRSTIRKDHGAELLETPCFTQGFCETFRADILRFAYGLFFVSQTDGQASPYEYLWNRIQPSFESSWKSC